RPERTRRYTPPLGVDAMASEPRAVRAALVDVPIDDDPFLARLLPVAANLMQYRSYYAGASAFLLVLMLLAPISHSHHRLAQRRAATEAGAAPAPAPAAAPGRPTRPRPLPRPSRHRPPSRLR